jgi:hypothetical protein
METSLMNHLVPNTTDHSDDAANANSIIGALRNLHGSRHCASCFKKDKECRMHCPSRERLETAAKFEEIALGGLTGPECQNQDNHPMLSQRDRMQMCL